MPARGAASVLAVVLPSQGATAGLPSSAVLLVPCSANYKPMIH